MGKVGHIHIRNWRIEWNEGDYNSFDFNLVFDSAGTITTQVPEIHAYVISTDNFDEGVSICKEVIIHFHRSSHDAIQDHLAGIIAREKQRREFRQQKPKGVEQQENSTPF